jgi:hypothetical protein
MRTQHLLATVTASIVAATPLTAQPALLVYRLGTDTLAVEQYTRTASGIVGEMIQRTPTAITRLQYEMTVGRDGRPATVTFKRMQQDGAPVAQGARETRIRFTADSAIREVIFPDSVQRRAFAATAAMVNFPVYVFGPTEFLVSMRRRVAADSIPALGLGGGLGFTGLVLASGVPTLQSTLHRDTTTLPTYRLRGAPYAMELRFDSSNRLQSVDGSNTTNKVVATRAAGNADLNALARAMKPSGALSGRDVARVVFQPGGVVLVDYGRPMVRERTVWGGTLVPFDSVWRAGANEATHLFTTRTLTMGDLVVPPGMYSLFVQHTRAGTYLIVNKQTGQWGTQYSPAQDLGRVALQMTATPAHVEEFTVMLKQLPGNRGVLEMSWGSMMASVPFAATVAR